MAYQQAYKDLAKNFPGKDSKTTLSPRNTDNNTPSQSETMREVFKAQVNQALSLSEKLQVDTVSTLCPEHAEEELQFYCFNNNTVVCAECIVKGAYAGLEISNTKKAAEKIRGKLGSLVEDADLKQEACDGLNKELQDQEVKIEEVFVEYEEDVKKEMENLRQAINKKEQELLEKVAAAKEEKLKNLKGSTGNIQEYQEDIHKIREAVKSHMSELNDVKLCNYYSRAGGAIIDHLNGKINGEIEKTNRTLKFLSMQNHLSLSAFHEDCQKLLGQIDHVSAHINKSKPIASQNTIEKTDFLVSATSKVSTPIQKDNELNDKKKVNRDALISDCLNQLDSTTPASGLINKPLQIDILSPKSTTPRQATSARSPLLSEMGKYDQDRNSYMKNFSQKYGPTQTHRSQATLAPRLDLNTFTKPTKTSILGGNNLLTEPSILSSRLTPRQDSTLLLKNPKVVSTRKWPADMSSEPFTMLKTGAEATKPVRRERNYSFLKPSTGTKEDNLLDLKRVGSLTARTETSIADKCVMRESKLKEKLGELSSRLFN